MALTFNKAVDLIKEYDGTNMLPSKWGEIVIQSMRECKDVVSPETWIRVINEDKLKGRAKSFYESSIEPKSIDDLIKLLVGRFETKEEIAELKERLNDITMDGSFEDYYAKKLAAFKLVSSLTDEEKLISIKKGFDKDTKIQALSITTLPAMFDYCVARDKIQMEESKKPELQAMVQRPIDKPRDNRPRFNGNCNWCKKRGHKEFECFKKRDGKPSFDGRIIKNMNVMENKQETDYVVEKSIFTMSSKMHWTPYFYLWCQYIGSLGFWSVYKWY